MPSFVPKFGHSSSYFNVASANSRPEAVLIRAPRVCDVLEGDKIGPGVDDAVGSERVDRLFAGQISLKQKNLLLKSRTRFPSQKSFFLLNRAPSWAKNVLALERSSGYVKGMPKTGAKFKENSSCRCTECLPIPTKVVS